MNKLWVTVLMVLFADLVASPSFLHAQDFVPLAGDVATICMLEGKSYLIPRPSCERISLTIIDAGPNSPIEPSGLLNLSIIFGPRDVSDSLELLNTKRKQLNQPPYTLLPTVFAKVSIQLPTVAQGSLSRVQYQAFKIGEEPREVQFRLGKDDLNVVLSLIKADPLWTPLLSIEANLGGSTIPLGAREPQVPIAISKTRVDRKLRVLKPTGFPDVPVALIIKNSQGKELRYVIDGSSLIIAGLTGEPIDFRIEYASSPGIVNVVPGRFAEWTDDIESQFYLPIDVKTLSLMPEMLNRVGTSARSFLLVTSNSNNDLYVASFEDEGHRSEVISRVLTQSGSQFKSGVIFGYDSEGAPTPVRPAEVNDLGLPKVFVKVGEVNCSFQDTVLGMADRKIRDLLGIRPSTLSERLFELRRDHILKSYFSDRLDRLNRPNGASVTEWCRMHNLISIPELAVLAPDLVAGCSLLEAKSENAALHVLDAILTARSMSIPDQSRALLDQIVQSFVEANLAKNNLPAATTRAVTMFPDIAGQISNSAQMLGLGQLFEDRGGVSNLREALIWYRRAADKGSNSALIHLGNFYENGLGITADVNEAIKHFRHAADAGDAEAQYRLALALLKAHPDDAGARTEAFELLRKSADGGFATAELRVGAIYERGEFGQPTDFERALPLYLRSISHGSTDAKVRLGRLYYDGRGVAKDDLRAAELFRSAAEAGNPNGQYYLGTMYESGRVAPGVNAGEALRLYRLAARQGQLEAIAKVLNSDAGEILGAATKAVDSANASESSSLLASITAAYARKGEYKTALALTSRIHNADFRANALVEIVNLQAKAKKFDAALKMVDNIDPAMEFARQTARYNLALALAESGDLKAAIQIAESLNPTFLRPNALHYISQRQAASSDPDGALATAKKIGDGDLGDTLRYQALGGAYFAYLKLGQADKATSILGEIKDDGVIVGVVWGLCKMGDSTHAIDVATKIHNDDERSRAFAGMSTALLESGKIDDAISMAQHAHETSWDRGRALREIVEHHLKAGNFAQAFTLIPFIKHPTWHEGTLGLIAVYQAKIQKFDDALTTAKSMANIPFIGINAPDKHSVIQLIAEEQLKHQGIDAAIATVELIVPNPSNASDPTGPRRVAVSRLARLRAEAGDVVGCSKIASYLPEASSKPDQIKWFTALAHAYAGDIAGAKSICTTIQDNAGRLDLLQEVASIQAERGDVNGAKLTATLLEDQPEKGTEFKSMALRRIAWAQLEAGQVLDAVETIRSIPTESGRERAMMDAQNQLAQKAISAAEAQKVSDAIHVASVQISVPANVSTLCCISASQAGSGDITGARETLDRARRLAESITEPRPRINALLEVEEQLLKTAEKASSLAASRSEVSSPLFRDT